MKTQEEILLERVKNGDAYALLELIENVMKISSIGMIRINKYLSDIRELDPKLGYYLSGKYYLIQALHNPQMKTYFKIGLDYLEKAAELNHDEAKDMLELIKR